MKSAMRWLNTNATVLISLSSMVIAASSLFFTISAQQTDMEYKEVSIQPRLTLNGDKLSLYFKNVGLGPAIIDEIHIKVAGKCISSNGKKQDEWHKHYTNFISEASQIYLQSLSSTWDEKKKINVETVTLNAGEAVPAGEERHLLRLEASSAKEVNKIGDDKLFNARLKFSDLALQVPIMLLVCSATGKTCEKIGITCT